METSYYFATPDYPILAHWDISYACNLHCEFCLSSSGKPRGAEYSTAQAKEMIDKLYDAGIIYLRILGGEPFFRKDILELLNYAVEKGMLLSFSTNATLITESIAKNLAQMVDSLRYIQVSLYGPDEAVYEEITGSKGSFQKVIRGLRNLREQGLEVAVLVIINEQSIERIQEYYDIAQSHGAKEIRFTPMVQMGRAQTLQCDADINSRNLIKVLNAIANLKTSGAEGPKIMIQARPLLGEYFQKIAPVATFSTNCFAGTGMLFMDPCGQTSPCPFVEQISAEFKTEHKYMGTLDSNGKSIDEIWDSLEFTQFRAYHDPGQNPRKIETNCKYYKNEDCKPCVITPCNCIDLIKELKSVISLPAGAK